MSKQKIVIKNQKGEDFIVPPGGSLGLLALGSVGVRAWRSAKNEWDNNQKNKLEKK